MSKNNYAQKKITRTMHLVASRNEFRFDDEDDYIFKISSYGPHCASDGDIYLAEAKFTMVVPDLDISLDQITIDMMREEQQTIRANAELAVNNIEETIQSMLCLPQPGDA